MCKNEPEPGHSTVVVQMSKDLNPDVVDSVKIHRNHRVRRLMKTSYLTWRDKLFFSCGHVYNDLVIAIWFSYTLLYFQLSFPGNIAGLFVLLGQVSDAITTIIIGFLSDRVRFPNLLARYGRKKTWHLIGTVIVTCTVPFTYNTCLGCQNASQGFQIAYYVFFIVLYQAGWAFVQVSHVSLITDLTPISTERVELNAYR